ncbi:YmdB family metallophosphoesterase [Candidatus Uhrbacteria bacterium]|nr:YmdB family metallophosphoesterase [Candidatus Uhrbacteria bacterium]
MKSKILFFGDIVGSIGRRAVCAILPRLREQYSPDVVLANVENLAHGRGITPKTLIELDDIGVTAYTSGNHIFENPNGLDCFIDVRWKDRLIRPHNLLAHRPGKGIMSIQLNGQKLFVVNLMGQLFMKDAVHSPFNAIDHILTHELLSTDDTKPFILIDFHAETTSEKEAFGHYVDGRVTGVFGTHTHVPTADLKVLPHGTAYVTDIGRNGAMDSVVGFEKMTALSRFLGKTQKSYDIAEHGVAEINAILLEIDLDCRTVFGLTRIQEKIDV